MKRLLSRSTAVMMAFAVLAALAAGGFAPLASPARAAAALVTLEPGGTVAVSADRVPVGELIRAIAAAAGISVIVADSGPGGASPGGNDTVTLQVKGADPAGLIALVARTRGLSVERVGADGGTWSIGTRPGPGGDNLGAGLAWQGGGLLDEDDRATGDDWAYREHSGPGGVKPGAERVDETMVTVTVGVSSISRKGGQIERGSLYGYEGGGHNKRVFGPLRLVAHGKVAATRSVSSSTARSFVVATVGSRAEIFHGDEVFFGGGFLPVSGARAGMGIGVRPLSAKPGGRVVLEIDAAVTQIDGWNRVFPDAGEMPIISGDRVSTTVSVEDGQTLEIGCYEASSSTALEETGADASISGGRARPFSGGASRERTFERPFTVITVTPEVMNVNNTYISKGD